MEKICAISGKEFEITEDDLKFYAKMGVPSPTLCPEERMRRRLAWRNERKLYHQTCSGTQKKIISMYNPQSNFLVYENDYWWSDHWNAQTFGEEFDFGKPFFGQFKDLLKQVPKMARVLQGENENSKFCNCASYNKNCHLIFTANENEDCMYGTWVNSCKDSVDCNIVVDSELLYQCVECADCYNVQYSQLIDQAHDMYHCYDCRYSNNLFACVGLRQKNYQVLNKPVSKEEFGALLTSPEKQKDVLKRLQELYLEIPKKHLDMLQSEGCIGDNILNCKNVKESFVMVDCEDCKYGDSLQAVKSSYDVSFYGSTGTDELLYECEGVGHGVFDSKFCKLCWGGCGNLEYCIECFQCKDCFGCTGLKKSQYCILNKQYSKEEYFKLRDQIIAHMKKTGEFGEFFPIQISLFGYNETVAQDFLPLTKKEVLFYGYNWKDEEQTTKYEGSIYQPPETISEVRDDICKQILQCESCKKHYRIQKAELVFYRKMNLPIPQKCPDCRHKDRMALRNPRKLWKRKCDKCSIEIQTTFSPERPEKVYCEECYLEFVN